MGRGQGTWVVFFFLGGAGVNRFAGSNFGYGDIRRPALPTIYFSKLFGEKKNFGWNWNLFKL